MVMVATIQSLAGFDTAVKAKRKLKPQLWRLYLVFRIDSMKFAAQMNSPLKIKQIIE